MLFFSPAFLKSTAVTLLLFECVNRHDVMQDLIAESTVEAAPAATATNDPDDMWSSTSTSDNAWIEYCSQDEDDEEEEEEPIENRRWEPVPVDFDSAIDVGTYLGNHQALDSPVIVRVACLHRPYLMQGVMTAFKTNSSIIPPTFRSA